MTAQTTDRPSEHDDLAEYVAGLTPERRAGVALAGIALDVAHFCEEAWGRERPADVAIMAVPWSDIDSQRLLVYLAEAGVEATVAEGTIGTGRYWVITAVPPRDAAVLATA